MAPTRDYRSQPPPPLPAWMTNFDPHEQQVGPMSPGWRPPGAGYAEMDQFNTGGMPTAGSMGERILNGNQALTSIDPQGYAVEGSAPTMGDRFGRAVNGALQGYDWGNTAANVGVGVGASFVPGGQVVNSGAGAVQGYRSDALDFNRRMPQGDGGQGPSISQPDVMPRGITGSGLLDPQPSGGGGGEAGYGGGPGGPVAPGFAANPIASRPLVPGQKPPVKAAPTGSGFTGGSGAMVDPYALPDEDTLESLLANAQRYTGYDAATGRTGRAGAASGAGGYSYAGFDFSQDPGNRDIGKSAKYAFSQFSEDAAKSGAPMPRTKAEAESWFNQHIAPKMIAAGYDVKWVKGDKAQIQTREGLDTIDFVGGADGDNPTLTWQSEVLAPGPGMQGGGGMGSGMSPGALPTGMDNISSSDLFEMLMQQARDVASGKSNGSPMLNTDALVKLLAGGK